MDVLARFHVKHIMQSIFTMFYYIVCPIYYGVIVLPGRTAQPAGKTPSEAKALSSAFIQTMTDNGIDTAIVSLPANVYAAYTSE
jgi:hypothetical protein